MPELMCFISIQPNNVVWHKINNHSPIYYLQQGSTETNMTHLYNMLQEEAKKVQKFKVQAMAQIKQKVQIS